LTVGADVFLDTNILMYAAQGRAVEPRKYEIARRIVIEENYATSGQVLAEFYHNVIKKGARPLTPEKAAEWVQTIAKKPCQPVDVHVVSAGIEMSQRYEISYWDGAILAAAERLGASIVYSEDLQNGQRYGAVQVVNPFI
jgi:predicted nucleic acid-binding protein